MGFEAWNNPECIILYKVCVSYFEKDSGRVEGKGKGNGWGKVNDPLDQVREFSTVHT
jgi:hypothetical protein